MSIGNTLARGRRDAGLSIAELSKRTGINLSLIDNIEHDDYAACGGDSRARDNIRAIALVIGVDAGPLIEAFDAAQPQAGWVAASKPSEPPMAAEELEALPPADESWPVAADDDTQPIINGPTSEPITAGEPVRVQAAISDRYPLIWITLGAALLAGAALGGILLLLGTHGQLMRHASAAWLQHSGARRATRPPVTRHPSSGHHAGAPRPSASAAAPAPRSKHVRPLVPVGISAFGPGGTGHGDSPQLARQALAGKSGTPWHSAWYTTPRFGNLQSGTGLLLNMGRKVTVTSARISLGNRPGADLALRIGNTPALSRMPPVARANDAGGIVHLTTDPTRGRYVLVWFSRLPPDQAGTFQVAVYKITLRGHR